jgi:hypothetical protein
MLLNQVLGCAETLLAHDGNASVMPIQTSCQHHELMIYVQSSQSLEGTVSALAVTAGPRIGNTNRSLDMLVVSTTEAWTC